MKDFRNLRVALIWTICLQLLLAPLAIATEGSQDIDNNNTPAQAGVFDSLTDDSSSGPDTNQPVADPDEPSDPSAEPPIQYFGLVITQVQTTGGTGRTTEDLIELRNNSDTAIDITGWSLRHTTMTGASSPTYVARFRPVESDPGWRLILPTRATYLLGSSKFVESNPAIQLDQLFSTSLTNNGGRLMIYNDEDIFVGGFAWGAGALPVEGMPFSPSSNVMERRMLDEEWHQDTRDNLGDFTKGQLRALYASGQAEEVFDACLNLDQVQEIVPEGLSRDEVTGFCLEPSPPVELNTCDGLVITEIGANIDRQFVEIHNPTSDSIDAGGCRLMTNRNQRYYEMENLQVAAGGYHVILISDTELILTKTTSGTVYLVSADGVAEVNAVSYANLRHETSWALVNDEWLQTYSITPGEPNIYQQYLPCEEGYERNAETGRCNRTVLAAQVAPCASNQYRNPETGRCRLVAVASSLTPCRPEQYRHPETNRCRNLTSAASTLTPCRPGQIRNPATNRCRSVEAGASTLKPCQEGWERNPATNRCRKSAAALVGTDDFAVEPIPEGDGSFAAWWALGGVVVLGASYGLWEWRRELTGWVGRLGGMMGK